MEQPLKNIIEAAILASAEPMKIDRIMALFAEDARPTKKAVQDAITELQADCAERGVELKEVASGYRYQVKAECAPWLNPLWEEKPPRYSKAFLETLVLIAYRQPITRGEIEEVRGVVVSTHIIRTLMEHEWIKEVGYRDVPGKPALFATTRKFLDYFNLKSLDELPTLSEIQDLDKVEQKIKDAFAAQGLAQLEMPISEEDTSGGSLAALEMTTSAPHSEHDEESPEEENTCHSEHCEESPEKETLTEFTSIP